MKKIRKLKDGQVVTIHDNDGIRKRCGCPRRSWGTCGHPWHFSFKAKGSKKHERFPLDKYADHPIRSRDEALAERDRLRILIRNGPWPPVASAPATPADLTLEQFGALWRERARSQQSDNQKANDKGIITRLCGIELVPGALLGQRPIGLFTVDDWEATFVRLAALAGSTFNKYRQAVIAMQEWACEKGYLPKPWLTGKVIKRNGAVARRKGARRDRRLIPDVLDGHGKIKQPGEERRLMTNAGPWLQRLIIAALETGCRRGELTSVLWQDVSLTRALLTVNRTKTYAASNAPLRQQLPISPRLLGVLKMIEHDPAGNPHPPSAYVFGDKIGRKVSDPKKAWAKACKAAGVVGLHFHDLRHEAGSRMLEAGWPLHHVQRMLGHQDAKTTSIYLNAAIGELADSMQRHGSGSRPLHNLAQAPDQERPPLVQDAEGSAPNQLVN